MQFSPEGVQPLTLPGDGTILGAGADLVLPLHLCFGREHKDLVVTLICYYEPETPTKALPYRLLRTSLILNVESFVGLEAVVQPVRIEAFCRKDHRRVLSGVTLTPSLVPQVPERLQEYFVSAALRALRPHPRVRSASRGPSTSRGEAHHTLCSSWPGAPRADIVPRCGLGAHGAVSGGRGGRDGDLARSGGHRGRGFAASPSRPEAQT